MLEVEVVGVPDPEWGERVVAFVAPDRRRSRWTAVRDLVSRASGRPRQLVTVDEIPLLPNGKPDRMKLKALA